MRKPAQVARLLNRGKALPAFLVLSLLSYIGVGCSAGCVRCTKLKKLVGLGVLLTLTDGSDGDVSAATEQRRQNKGKVGQRKNKVKESKREQRKTKQD